MTKRFFHIFSTFTGRLWISVVVCMSALVSFVRADEQANANLSKTAESEAKKGKFVYPKDIEREPFESLVDPAGMLNVKMVRQEGDLKLTGIVYGGNTPDVVVINNEVFYEGDIIGVYQVKTIAPDRVKLKSEAREIELVLPEDMVYAPTTTNANGGPNAKK